MAFCQVISAAKRVTNTNSRPFVYSSNKRLASVVSLMLALRSLTLASTHQRSNGYRTASHHLSSTLRDHSSDNHYPSICPFENQQIYFSENEYEERIVSALAKADEEASSFAFSEFLSSTSSTQRRKSRRRKRRRRKRIQQQAIISSRATTAGEGEETEGLEGLETSRDCCAHGQVDVNTHNLYQDGISPPRREKRSSRLEEDSVNAPRIQMGPFNSRMGELESKMNNRRAQQNLSNERSGERQKQAYPEPGNNVAPRPSAFVTPSRPTEPPMNRHTNNRASSSRYANPPNPLTPGRASKAKANRTSSSTPGPTASTNQQTTPKSKPTRPAFKRPSTLTSAKDNSVSHWVRKFHSTRPKDCLVLVPREYLLDNFNLARLAPVVEYLATEKQKELEASSPSAEQKAKEAAFRTAQQQQNNNHLAPKYAYPIYRQALELILRQNGDSKEEPSQVVQYAAEVLYTLVHARFVVSPRGLDTIRSRMMVLGSKSINQPLFGRCPRLDCGGMPLLPCGLADDFGSDDAAGHDGRSCKAKRYCCQCQQTFHCWESKVDGSAWGTSVAHLLLMIYGKGDLFSSHFAAVLTDSSASPGNNMDVDVEGNLSRFSPGRIFGFPIHPPST